MMCLEGIQKMVSEIAKKINAPISEVLTFGISRDDGTPCVQIEGENYYYIARDRDVLTIQKQTDDIDELLYWVFCGITSEMAEEYAVKHPVNQRFSRKVKFTRQLDLLEQINMVWARKREQEIKEILHQYPYVDDK